MSGWTLEFLVDDLGILEVRIQCGLHPQLDLRC